MAIRQTLGNMVDLASTAVGRGNLPDLKFSELIAGGNTANTGITPGSQRTFGDLTRSNTQSPSYNPWPVAPATRVIPNSSSAPASTNQGARVGANYRAGDVIPTGYRAEGNTLVPIDANAGNSGGGGGGVDPFLQAIDEAFGASIGFANQAESTLRGQQPGIESDINSLIGASKNSLTGERDISQRQIGAQEEGGRQRREDASAAARRLYNELVTGGRQRFGGASSAGEAFEALSGRELQRNRQGIEQNFSNFMGQIENARNEVQTRYASALENLETKKVTMLNESRREFQNKLLEIDRLRATAAQEKANRKLAALQDLRNQAFQINLATAQAKNSVDTLRQQAEGELQSALQAFGQSTAQGSQAQSNLLSAVPTQYQTANTISDGGGASQLAFNQTGRVSQGRDEEEDILSRQFGFV